MKQNTMTGKALGEIYSKFQSGPNQNNVLIVLTDGEATDPEEVPIQANHLKSAGFTIFSVGVGRAVNQEKLKEQLLEMASEEKSEHMFTAENFEDLQDSLLGKLSKQLCEDQVKKIAVKKEETVQVEIEDSENVQIIFSETLLSTRTSTMQSFELQGQISFKFAFTDFQWQSIEYASQSNEQVCYLFLNIDQELVTCTSKIVWESEQKLLDCFCQSHQWHEATEATNVVTTSNVGKYFVDGQIVVYTMLEDIQRFNILEEYQRELRVTFQLTAAGYSESSYKFCLDYMNAQEGGNIVCTAEAKQGYGIECYCSSVEKKETQMKIIEKSSVLEQEAENEARLSAIRVEILSEMSLTSQAMFNIESYFQSQDCYLYSGLDEDTHDCSLSEMLNDDGTIFSSCFCETIPFWMKNMYLSELYTAGVVEFELEYSFDASQTCHSYAELDETIFDCIQMENMCECSYKPADPKESTEIKRKLANMEEVHFMVAYNTYQDCFEFHNLPNDGDISCKATFVDTSVFMQCVCYQVRSTEYFHTLIENSIDRQNRSVRSINFNIPVVFKENCYAYSGYNQEEITCVQGLTDQETALTCSCSLKINAKMTKQQELYFYGDIHFDIHRRIKSSCMDMYKFDENEVECVSVEEGLKCGIGKRCNQLPTKCYCHLKSIEANKQVTSWSSVDSQIEYLSPSEQLDTESGVAVFNLAQNISCSDVFFEEVECEEGEAECDETSYCERQCSCVRKVAVIEISTDISVDNASTKIDEDQLKIQHGNVNLVKFLTEEENGKITCYEFTGLNETNYTCEPQDTGRCLCVEKLDVSTCYLKNNINPAEYKCYAITDKETCYTSPSHDLDTICPSKCHCETSSVQQILETKHQESDMITVFNEFTSTGYAKFEIDTDVACHDFLMFGKDEVHCETSILEDCAGGSCLKTALKTCSCKKREEIISTIETTTTNEKSQKIETLLTNVVKDTTTTKSIQDPKIVKVIHEVKQNLTHKFYLSNTTLSTCYELMNVSEEEFDCSVADYDCSVNENKKIRECETKCHCAKKITESTTQVDIQEQKQTKIGSCYKLMKYSPEEYLCNEKEDCQVAENNKDVKCSKSCECSKKQAVQVVVEKQIMEPISHLNFTLHNTTIINYHNIVSDWRYGGKKWFKESMNFQVYNNISCLQVLNLEHADWTDSEILCTSSIVKNLRECSCRYSQEIFSGPIFKYTNTPWLFMYRRYYNEESIKYMPGETYTIMANEEDDCNETLQKSAVCKPMEEPTVVAVGQQNCVCTKMTINNQIYNSIDKSTNESNLKNIDQVISQSQDGETKLIHSEVETTQITEEQNKQINGKTIYLQVQTSSSASCYELMNIIEEDYDCKQEEVCSINDAGVKLCNRNCQCSMIDHSEFIVPVEKRKVINYDSIGDKWRKFYFRWVTESINFEGYNENSCAEILNWEESDIVCTTSISSFYRQCSCMYSPEVLNTPRDPVESNVPYLILYKMYHENSVNYLPGETYTFNIHLEDECNKTFQKSAVCSEKKEDGNQDFARKIGQKICICEKMTRHNQEYQQIKTGHTQKVQIIDHTITEENYEQDYEEESEVDQSELLEDLLDGCFKINNLDRETHDCVQKQSCSTNELGQIACETKCNCFKKETLKLHLKTLEETEHNVETESVNETKHESVEVKIIDRTMGGKDQDEEEQLQQKEVKIINRVNQFNIEKTITLDSDPIEMITKRNVTKVHVIEEENPMVENVEEFQVKIIDRTVEDQDIKIINHVNIDKSTTLDLDPIEVIPVKNFTVVRVIEEQESPIAENVDEVDSVIVINEIKKEIIVDQDEQIKATIDLPDFLPIEEKEYFTCYKMNNVSEDTHDCNETQECGVSEEGVTSCVRNCHCVQKVIHILKPVMPEVLPIEEKEYFTCYQLNNVSEESHECTETKECDFNGKGATSCARKCNCVQKVVKILKPFIPKVLPVEEKEYFTCYQLNNVNEDTHECNETQECGINEEGVTFCKRNCHCVGKEIHILKPVLPEPVQPDVLPIEEKEYFTCYQLNNVNEDTHECNETQECGINEEGVTSCKQNCHCVGKEIHIIKPVLPEPVQPEVLPVEEKEYFTCYQLNNVNEDTHECNETQECGVNEEGVTSCKRNCHCVGKVIHILKPVLPEPVQPEVLLVEEKEYFTCYQMNNVTEDTHECNETQECGINEEGVTSCKRNCHCVGKVIHILKPVLPEPVQPEVLPVEEKEYSTCYQMNNVNEDTHECNETQECGVNEEGVTSCRRNCHCVGKVIHILKPVLPEPVQPVLPVEEKEYFTCYQMNNVNEDTHECNETQECGVNEEGVTSCVRNCHCVQRIVHIIEPIIPEVKSDKRPADPEVLLVKEKHSFTCYEINNITEETHECNETQECGVSEEGVTSCKRNCHCIKKMIHILKPVMPEVLPIEEKEFFTCYEMNNITEDTHECNETQECGVNEEGVTSCKRNCHCIKKMIQILKPVMPEILPIEEKEYFTCYQMNNLSEETHECNETQECAVNEEGATSCVRNCHCVQKVIHILEPIPEVLPVFNENEISFNEIINSTDKVDSKQNVKIISTIDPIDESIKAIDEVAGTIKVTVKNVTTFVDKATVGIINDLSNIGSGVTNLIDELLESDDADISISSKETVTKKSQPVDQYLDTSNKMINEFLVPDFKILLELPCESFLTTNSEFRSECLEITHICDFDQICMKTCQCVKIRLNPYVVTKKVTVEIFENDDQKVNKMEEKIIQDYEETVETVDEVIEESIKVIDDLSGTVTGTVVNVTKLVDETSEEFIKSFEKTIVEEIDDLLDNVETRLETEIELDQDIEIHIDEDYVDLFSDDIDVDETDSSNKKVQILHVADDKNKESARIELEAHVYRKFLRYQIQTQGSVEFTLTTVGQTCYEFSKFDEVEISCGIKAESDGRVCLCQKRITDQETEEDKKLKQIISWRKQLFSTGQVTIERTIKRYSSDKASSCYSYGNFDQEIINCYSLSPFTKEDYNNAVEDIAFDLMPQICVCQMKVLKLVNPIKEAISLNGQVSFTVAIRQEDNYSESCFNYANLDNELVECTENVIPGYNIKFCLCTQRELTVIETTPATTFAPEIETTQKSKIDFEAQITPEGMISFKVSEFSDCYEHSGYNPEEVSCVQSKFIGLQSYTLCNCRLIINSSSNVNVEVTTEELLPTVPETIVISKVSNEEIDEKVEVQMVSEDPVTEQPRIYTEKEPVEQAEIKIETETMAPTQQPKIVSKTIDVSVDLESIVKTGVTTFILPKEISTDCHNYVIGQIMTYSDATLSDADLDCSAQQLSDSSTNCRCSLKKQVDEKIKAENEKQISILVDDEEEETDALPDIDMVENFSTMLITDELPDFTDEEEPIEVGNVYSEYIDVIPTKLPEKELEEIEEEVQTRIIQEISEDPEDPDEVNVELNLEELDFVNIETDIKTDIETVTKQDLATLQMQWLLTIESTGFLEFSLPRSTRKTCSDYANLNSDLYGCWVETAKVDAKADTCKCEKVPPNRARTIKFLRVLYRTGEVVFDIAGNSEVEACHQYAGLDEKAVQCYILSSNNVKDECTCRLSIMMSPMEETLTKEGSVSFSMKKSSGKSCNTYAGINDINVTCNILRSSKTRHYCQCLSTLNRLDLNVIESDPSMPFKPLKPVNNFKDETDAEVKEETRLRLEEETRLRLEEETRLRLEEETRLRLEEEARLREEAEREAKRQRLAEEARIRLEAEQEKIQRQEKERLIIQKRREHELYVLTLKETLRSEGMIEFEVEQSWQFNCYEFAQLSAHDYHCLETTTDHGKQCVCQNMPIPEFEVINYFIVRSMWKANYKQWFKSLYTFKGEDNDVCIEMLQENANDVNCQEEVKPVCLTNSVGKEYCQDYKLCSCQRNMLPIPPRKTFDHYAARLSYKTTGKATFSRYEDGQDGYSSCHAVLETNRDETNCMAAKSDAICREDGWCPPVIVQCSCEKIVVEPEEPIIDYQSIRTEWKMGYNRWFKNSYYFEGNSYYTCYEILQENEHDLNCASKISSDGLIITCDCSRKMLPIPARKYFDSQSVKFSFKKEGFASFNVYQDEYASCEAALDVTKEEAVCNYALTDVQCREDGWCPPSQMSCHCEKMEKIVILPVFNPPKKDSSKYAKVCKKMLTKKPCRFLNKCAFNEDSPHNSVIRTHCQASCERVENNFVEIEEQCEHMFYRYDGLVCSKQSGSCISLGEDENMDLEFHH